MCINTIYYKQNNFLRVSSVILEVILLVVRE